MPKKRTAAEASSNGQPNDGSDPASQQVNNAKRAKLTPSSDTTLQDLPTELMQCILVKVVAMEVKGWWLAKSAWKEQVDLVISRLGDVCSQWSSIFATDFFRSELHRTLDGIAEEPIYLETLNHSPIGSEVTAMTAMNDELFMLYDQECVIKVYDRNNMSKVKDVIPLPGTDPVRMAACSVSNCVYVALRNNKWQSLTVLRITKDVNHQYNISPWLKDYKRPISMMSVSANGNLIILSLLQKVGTPDIVSICDANGILQHEIMLTPDDNVYSYVNVLQKSNGNVILAYIDEQDYQVHLGEIDMSGSVVRTYQSSASEDGYVNFADVYGRVMITEPWKEEIELLDSEFNHLGIYIAPHVKDRSLFHYDLHYESESNEIVHVYFDKETKTKKNVLTRLRFTSE